MTRSPAKRPRIVFFIDPKLWPRGEIPTDPSVPWTAYQFGTYCWLIQTVLRLKRAGYDCELSSEFPEAGIVLTYGEHHVSCDTRLFPGRNRLLIDVAGDIDLYLPANLHVVQNPTQAFWFRNCHYIPLWPQPGLKPRLPSPRFANVSFLGYVTQFASDLRGPDWGDRLRNLGLNWVLRSEVFQYNNPAHYRIGDGPWSDLTEIDAVVAVRQFTSYPTFDHKPPSKLINCWLAGIPAILGAESAFRSLYRTELDYFEVHSKEEVVEALVRLKEKPDLRSAMVENGLKRSRELNAEALTERWIRFLEDVAIPTYYSWVGMSKAAQKMSLVDVRISNAITRARRKISIPTGPPRGRNA